MSKRLFYFALTRTQVYLCGIHIAILGPLSINLPILQFSAFLTTFVIQVFDIIELFPRNWVCLWQGHEVGTTHLTELKRQRSAVPKQMLGAECQGPKVTSITC